MRMLELYMRNIIGHTKWNSNTNNCHIKNLSNRKNTGESWSHLIGNRGRVWGPRGASFRRINSDLSLQLPPHFSLIPLTVFFSMVPISVTYWQSVTFTSLSLTSQMFCFTLCLCLEMKPCLYLFEHILNDILFTRLKRKFTLLSANSRHYASCIVLYFITF